MDRICKNCGRPFDPGGTQRTVCPECRARTNKETMRRYWAKRAQQAKPKTKKKSNVQQIRELANLAFMEGKTYGKYMAERKDDE